MDSCLVTDNGADATDRQVLECLVTQQTTTKNDFARSVLLVYAAGLVFFMQAGFAMVCAGGVRKKNVQNTSKYGSLSFYMS